jgi:hypothetical protein
MVGLVSVATTILSLFVVMTIFGSIGVLPTDPINYLFSVFTISAIPDAVTVGITVTFAIVAFIVNAILTGAAIKFALDDYGGLTAEVGSSISYSFGKTTKIVTIQLLLALIVSAVTAPSLAMLNLALEGIDITDPFNPIITPEAMQFMMMGMLLLLVGSVFMLFISVKFAPAIAIVVDTDLSAIDSLKKSWQITNGNFLHVLGGQILIGIAVGILTAIVGIPLSILLFMNPWAIVLEVMITALLFSAPSMIYIAVLYRDLMARSGSVESDLPEYVL